MANPRTVARLEVQIQRRLAHCLQFEIADPRGAFITITRVELNGDLSTAKAYYSVLGTESERSKAAHMLEHAGGFTRRQMGSVLRTKSIPALKWIYDDTIASAEAMEELLAKTKQRDAAIRGEEAPADSPSGPEPSSEADPATPES